jgi:hypothetical protein
VFGHALALSHGLQFIRSRFCRHRYVEHPEIHKRLMPLATASMMPPAIDFVSRA